MKLFLLKRHWDASFDGSGGAIIRAENEKRARKLAAKKLLPPPENKTDSVWMDRSETDCIELIAIGKQRMLAKFLLDED